MPGIQKSKELTGTWARVEDFESKINKNIAKAL